MMKAGTDFTPELTARLSPAERQGGAPHRAVPCAVQGEAFLSRPRRQVFPGRPDQVGCARRFVSRVLGGCPAGPDAVLLTSELVTNALQHTATGTGGDFVVVAGHGAGHLRVTVTDDGSPGAPALGSRAPLATSGQGMVLVTALAARWGHHGTSTAGPCGSSWTADARITRRERQPGPAPPPPGRQPGT